MDKYLFICIGTNKIIEDSFGPMVGDILLDSFKDCERIKIYGTMTNPVHLKNIKMFSKEIFSMDKYKEYIKIIIDSAYSKEADIGKIYVGLGGMEIGKVYGKGIYIPADLKIKTVVMNNKKININENKNKFKNENINEISKKAEIDMLERIKRLSYITANKIIEIIK